MTDEIQARVRLKDGRRAWRDGQGRYRDAESGRFIPGEQVKAEEKTGAQLEGARERARAHLLAAVRALGLDADSAEDAWGRLVAVQARIALDEAGGAKATAAAKLVAQATGLIDEEEAGDGDGIRLEMTAEDAKVLLRLIREERGRREAGRADYG